MTNVEIEKKFKLAARLMELHGENPFKLRSYQTAADTVYNLQLELSGMSIDEITAIEGIGKGMANNISELLNSNTFEKGKVDKKSCN